MTISLLAGKPSYPSLLINLPRLVTSYYTGPPNPSVPAQRVGLELPGISAPALDHGVKEAYILAISQAICLYRKQQRIDGPLNLRHGSTRFRSRLLPALWRCWRRMALR